MNPGGVRTVVRISRFCALLLPLLLLISATAHASTPTATYTLKRVAPEDITLLNTFTLTLDSSASGTTPVITVTGSVTLGGTFVLDATGAPFPAGKTYLIIANDGNDPIIGTFPSLPEGTIITSGGQSFAISYVGGTGNDLVLTALPLVPALEPIALAALAMMVAAVALLAMRR